ncbi:hypothetical protein GCK32_017610 [Trichostrongylus colubriformis]|uniref:Uncharacterized protein n=1 Tax=Trichostrongylus colubriformis TaxID=6319 RepID=A0AAN8J2N3_TRICO
MFQVRKNVALKEMLKACLLCFVIVALASSQQVDPERFCERYVECAAVATLEERICLARKAGGEARPGAAFMSFTKYRPVLSRRGKSIDLFGTLFDLKSKMICDAPPHAMQKLFDLLQNSILGDPSFMYPTTASPVSIVVSKENAAE